MVNTYLTIWDLLQAIFRVANRQSLDMVRRCKELCNIHQIKSTIHCLGINLASIWVLWVYILMNSYRFLTSAIREMYFDHGDSIFHSLIGRSIHALRARSSIRRYHLSIIYQHDDRVTMHGRIPGVKKRLGVRTWVQNCITDWSCYE